ncbi:MAG TPA: hypothetical protein VHB25_08655 [Gemmatimonadaceae bacterium]|nr:hypothetical protein [Gemmatimonadaceae bacterium]
MIDPQVPRAVADSARRATEQALRATLDSLQRVTELRAHSAYDRALANSTSLAATSGQWTSIAIALLAALFAVLAIFAAIMIFLQSRDFSQRTEKLFIDADARIQDVIDDQRARGAALLAEKAEELEEIKRRASEAVESAKSTSPADETRRVRSEAELESLTDQLRRLESTLTIATQPMSSDAMARAYDAWMRYRLSRPRLAVREGVDEDAATQAISSEFGLSPGRIAILKDLLCLMDPRLVESGSDESIRRAFAATQRDPATGIGRGGLQTGLRSRNITDSNDELTNKGIAVLRRLASLYVLTRNR